MSYRRFQKFMLVVLLLLHTSAASFAATVIYAQTTSGLIYKSTDTAQTWQPLSTQTSPASGAALAVDPRNTNNLYSIFKSANKSPTPPPPGLFRSTDGGQTWVKTLISVSAPIAVDATASNIVYVFGDNGGKIGMFRSTDSGVSFQAVTIVAGSTNTGISVIRNDPSQPGTVYAVVSGSAKGIYKSTDYGATWALFASSSTVFGNIGGTIDDLAIDPKNSSVLYVAAYSSTCGTTTARCGLLKSSDAGKTWQAIFADDCGNVVVDPRNGNIYAGGYLGTLVTGTTPGGEVVRSTDGGKTFTRLTTGLISGGAEVHLDPELPNVLYGSQSRTVDISQGIKPSGVFVSTDYGATWTLGTVDPKLAPPNDDVFSLVALTITNPPPGVVNVSAAGGRSDLFAPDAIVSAFGTGLATGTAGATTNPPLTTLGGATVTVTDSAGTSQPAELLYVSSGQINYIVPDGLAAGAATVAFNSGSGIQNQTIQLGPVAPGMFTLNSAGLAAGSVLRVSGDGTQTAENFFQMDSSGNISALPINLGPATDQVFLILYGTGFRAAGTANAAMTIGGQNAQVSFAGPQGAFAGLDQVNVLVPRSLAGSGSVSIVLTASGQTANTVNLSVQ